MVNGVIFSEGSAPIQELKPETESRVNDNLSERLIQDLNSLRYTRWAVKQVMVTPTIANISHDLQSGTLVGVSDRSF